MLTRVCLGLQFSGLIEEVLTLILMVNDLSINPVDSLQRNCVERVRMTEETHFSWTEDINDTIYLLNTKQNSYNLISIAQNQGQMGTRGNKIHFIKSISRQMFFMENSVNLDQQRAKAPPKCLSNRSHSINNFWFEKNMNVCIKHLLYQYGLILNMFYSGTVV